MPHGTGDWADLIPKSTVFGGIDLGELAVRLGSNNFWDRRGNVIFYDDFQSGIGRVGWLVGLDGSIEWSSEHSLSGGYSVKFSTDKLLLLYTLIRKFLPCPPKSAFGSEVAICTGEDIVHFRWSMLYYDGTNHSVFRVRYTLATEILEYWDGDWHTFATDVKFAKSVDLFHIAKLVADMETGKYVRFIFDNVTYDMGKYSGDVDLDDTSPYLDVEVLGFGDEDDNYVWFVDDLIVTQNEP